MLKCFFYRRKIYEYVDGGLSELDKARVKQHLLVCDYCRRKAEEARAIINSAKEALAPEPSDDFWHDFKIGLDRKLNSILLPQFESRRTKARSPRPVIAYATAFVMVLAVSTYLYFSRLPAINSEAALVNEAAFIDEVSPGSLLGRGEDTYIEEINLIYLVDSNPA